MNETARDKLYDKVKELYNIWSDIEDDYLPKLINDDYAVADFNMRLCDLLDKKFNDLFDILVNYPRMNPRALAKTESL